MAMPLRTNSTRGNQNGESECLEQYAIFSRNKRPLTLRSGDVSSRRGGGTRGATSDCGWNVRRAKQFSVKAADRPGLLPKLVSTLWEEGVNIRAFEAVFDGSRGTIHVVVETAVGVGTILRKPGLNATDIVRRTSPPQKDNFLNTPHSKQTVNQKSAIP